MKYKIEMLNITKEFPGIKANDNITLQIKNGEIHALLGENGAGKSTLMSILFGLYQPDEGKIKKDDTEVFISNPNDANKIGIGMVHQHFKLVSTFTVLQNIILGVETVKFSFLQMDVAKNKVLKLIEKYKLDINPDELVCNISVGMQQRVEILKMLYRDNDILIFDEPTAVLTPNEISELMKIMKNLSDEGKSILFITHKLAEIKQVADRCTILRKGKYIDTVDVSSVSEEQLSRLMVGKDINMYLEKIQTNNECVVLDVQDLTIKSDNNVKNIVENVSFSVRQGEVLCIAGIDGNGQTELIQGITGLRKISSGSIRLLSEDITKSTVRQRNTKGISHIPEDRHKHGLVLEYSLADNLILQRYFLKPFSKNGFLINKARDEYAASLIEKYDIRSGQGNKTIMRSLSGGNQQKAIISREIDKNPELLIAVQPTRGLDVGAISYIHKQIINQRNQNKAVLLVSLELDEVMRVSDRIIVIYEGKLVGEFDPKLTTVQEIGLYMSGAKARI